MVLESLIKPRKMLKTPWHMIFVAIVYTIIAVFFAWRIFPSEASILSVAFITILFVPLFQKIFKIDEKEERQLALDKLPLAKNQKIHQNIFSRHKQIITLYSLFFIGVIIAMSLIYIFAPQLNIFSAQTTTLRSMVTGTVTGEVITGYYSQAEVFMKYFLNNSQTMILAFIISILFGTGAVFILAWNASIIAVYLGVNIQHAVSQGSHIVTAYVSGVPLGLAAIALHGVPEISAYFFAGIAGGILSVGILREKYGTPEFWQIVRDSIIFLITAEILIILAAWLEAFI